MHGKCSFTQELIHSHRADLDRRALINDRTYVQVADDTKIIGTSHALNRGYVECRSILNITELFGIRSVRIEKQIDLVITFTEWFLGMKEERTGLETNHFSILGADIPHIKFPSDLAMTPQPNLTNGLLLTCKTVLCNFCQLAPN